MNQFHALLFFTLSAVSFLPCDGGPAITPNQAPKVLAHPGKLEALRFLSEDKIVSLCAESPNRVGCLFSIWDLTSKKDPLTIRRDKEFGPFYPPCSFTDKGTFFVCGPGETFYEVNEKKVTHAHKVPGPYWNWSISVSSSGKRLALGQQELKGGRKHLISLWRIAKEVEQGKTIDLDGRTHAITFSPDEKTIAFVGAYAWLEIWNLEPFERRCRIKLPRPPGWQVAFSPRNDMVACFDSDNTILVGLKDNQVIKNWSASEGAGYCAFSRDGKEIALGGNPSNEYSVTLWDIETSIRKRATLSGHTDLVTTLDYSPSARQLASGSKDNTIRVWKLK